MPWTWYQTGELRGPSPEDWRTQGYSGRGEHKNRPEDQELEDLGPIPCGGYTIGPPHDTNKHGPFVLSLTPAGSNQMFGRFAFLIHGDSKDHPGAASDGCIVLSRPAREKIWASGDRDLMVRARPPVPSMMVDPGMEAE